MLAPHTVLYYQKSLLAKVISDLKRIFARHIRFPKGTRPARNLRLPSTWFSWCWSLRGIIHEHDMPITWYIEAQTSKKHRQQTEQKDLDAAIVKIHRCFAAHTGPLHLPVKWLFVDILPLLKSDDRFAIAIYLHSWIQQNRKLWWAFVLEGLKCWAQSQRELKKG